MRKCSSCGIEKNESEFYKKTASRRQSMCKPCFNTYCMNRWTQRKKDAVKAKGGKCFDCEKVFPYYVYDFHHLNPEAKEFDWNKMKLVSKAKLEIELEKCVLLCSNCHRTRHFS